MRAAAAYRIFGYVKLAGATVSGTAIFGMMLLIVFDVVARNFLGGSIRGGFEIVQNYFMPLAVFPSLGYVYASGILPRMDLATRRLPARVRALITRLLLALELAISSLLTLYTWKYAMSGLDRAASFPAAGTLYPLWPFMFLAPLGFALILVETAFQAWRELAREETRTSGVESPTVAAGDT